MSRYREDYLLSDMKKVIDVCCGSKMFWFDKSHEDVVFMDKRRETYSLKDKSSRLGIRSLIIDPDIVANFTAIPFTKNSFSLVVFDSPHLIGNGKSGWLAKKYGKLESDWREELSRGFAEGFRVLKKDGILVFKWSNGDIPVSELLALTPYRPLFGNKCGKASKSHWLVFMKGCK